MIDSLKLQDHEVQDRDGRWHSLRIRPYRTSENKIEGAVLVLLDIDEIKRGLDEVTQLISQPLLVLSGDCKVQRANPAFCQKFQINPEAAVDCSLFALGGGAWNIPALRNLLEGVLPEQKRVDAFPIQHEFPGLGRLDLRLSARVLQQESKGTRLVLLAIEDVTNRKE